LTLGSSLAWARPEVFPNPEAVLPQGGKKFDPSKPGLPLGEGQSPPYTLRFTGNATFTYVCVVHAGMAGKVRVVGPNRSIPSARRDRREAQTFTFGPTNGNDAYNDVLAAGLLGETFDPRGAYPSESPSAGVPTITTAQHGNRLLQQRDPRLGSAKPAPVGAAGKYQLICLITRSRGPR